MNHSHLHHAHIFSSDISKSLEWWKSNFDAVIYFDGEMGGSRNIFIKVGEGRLHLYDQQPRGLDFNAIHHLGIRVLNIDEAVLRMRDNGVNFRNSVRRFEGWSYIMCSAPDNILLEVFEVSGNLENKNLREYFSDSSSEF